MTLDGIYFTENIASLFHLFQKKSYVGRYEENLRLAIDAFITEPDYMDEDKKWEIIRVLTELLRDLKEMREGKPDNGQDEDNSPIDGSKLELLS